MAIETVSTVRERCVRCGSAHRPSYFERACRCPVCGLPLQGSPSREPLRLPRIPLAIGAAVLLGVGVIGLAVRAPNGRRGPGPAAASLAAPRPVVVPTAPVTRRAELDPELGAVLQERARVLAQDAAAASARAPELEPLAVAALAETRLYQALVSRDLKHDDQAARRSLREARALVQRLASRGSFVAYPLRMRLDHFSQLRLREGPSGSVAARLWPMDTGRELIFPLPLVTVGGSFMLGGSEAVPPPPIGAPPPGAPPPWLPRGAGPPGGSGDAVPGGGVGALPPERNAPTDAEQEGDDPEKVLARARDEFAAHPDQPHVAERLAQLLAPPAPRRRRRQPSELEDPVRRRHLEEAARVYRRAAEKAPLRVIRAAFYHAAGGVYLRLEDWEQQHEVLKLATQAAPFAADLWSDLGKSALRLADLDENQRALNKARKRRLPAMGLDPVPGQEWNRMPGGPAFPPPAPADAIRH